MFFPWLFKNVNEKIAKSHRNQKLVGEILGEALGAKRQAHAGVLAGLSDELDELENAERMVRMFYLRDLEGVEKAERISWWGN
jgi:hypothetical protein